MNIRDFTDDRIFAVLDLGHDLTPEEREFLATDTPTFEECEYSEAQLRAMDDRELMEAAYTVWAAYASTQG